MYLGCSNINRKRTNVDYEEIKSKRDPNWQDGRTEFSLM